MSRLIDADKFTKQIAGTALVNNYPATKALALCKLIDSQPAAYDVDNVLEQLREQQEKLETDMFARESDNWYGQYCNGIHEGIDKAIEIIKAGGIDGN